MFANRNVDEDAIVTSAVVATSKAARCIPGSILQTIAERSNQSKLDENLFYSVRIIHNFYSICRESTYTMFSRFISTTARRSAGVARKCLDWSFHFGFVLPPLSFVCPLPLLSALLFPFPSQKFCPIHPLLLRTHGHRTAANDTQRGILLNLWACSHPALFSRSTMHTQVRPLVTWPQRLHSGPLLPSLQWLLHSLA